MDVCVCKQSIFKKDSSDNWRVAQTLKISFKYCEVIEEVNIYILMQKDVLLRKQIAEYYYGIFYLDLSITKDYMTPLGKEHLLTLPGRIPWKLLLTRKLKSGIERRFTSHCPSQTPKLCFLLPLSLPAVSFLDLLLLWHSHPRCQQPTEPPLHSLLFSILQ